MGRRGRSALTATDYATAAVAAGAVLAMALFGARGLRTLADERRATEDRQVVGAVALAVAQDLDDTITAVSSAARDVTAPVPISLASLALPGASNVAFVSVEALGSGDVAVLPRDDPAGEVAALLDRARDSAQTVISAPVELSGGVRTLVVAAAYRRDPTVGRPFTAVDRRSRVTGWVVAAVDLDALVGAHLPPGAQGAIRDGRTLGPAGEGTATARLPEQSFSRAGRDFVVRAGDPSGVGSPSSAIVVVLAGALLAGAAAAGVLVAAAARRRLKEALARRDDQVELIAEVSPLVQQSLELAEVLPAVAIQLIDHFGLTGVALSTGAGTAAVRLFSVGERADPEATPVLSPPEALEAGETLVLSMQRGGRAVARLELVAGRDLDAPDLQSLRALTELITAAVVNASLYASQQEALRNLQELDALKTVFLGTASHELRTPATAITGFASLLADNWERFGEEQRRDFVGRIEANARSLSAVVQDLLDFSLLDGGTVALTVEPIDLPRLVEGVVERLGPLFTDHEVSVRSEPAPPVDGDANGLERAITNLLTNAVKFSPPGTTVTVAVGPTLDGDGAEVAVSDEGPGIPPAERARVFTRFYRGAGDEVVQTRGVGIGLSVVSELVTRLHGEVVLDEAPGGGARFTIRLPAGQSPAIDKEIEDAPTT